VTKGKTDSRQGEKYRKKTQFLLSSLQGVLPVGGRGGCCPPTAWTKSKVKWGGGEIQDANATKIGGKGGNKAHRRHSHRGKPVG